MSVKNLTGFQLHLLTEALNKHEAAAIAEITEIESQGKQPFVTTDYIKQEFQEIRKALKLKETK